MSPGLYQAIAENGPADYQGPNMLVQCGNNLKGLTPAHGIILSDGHPGKSDPAPRSVNPAIADDVAIFAVIRGKGEILFDESSLEEVTAMLGAWGKEKTANYFTRLSHHSS